MHTDFEGTLGHAASDRATTIHSELRSRTALLHRELEEQLDLLDPGLGIARYGRVVHAFYGFYVPLERELDRFARFEEPLGFPLACRTAWLERDIVALGTASERLGELPRCSELPPVICLEHVAGCLYVVEGASLGGKLITRALGQNLGIDAESGAAFFYGHGEGTAARWKRFLGWLDGVAMASPSPGAIVTAACATFRALARWTQAQDAFR